MRLWPLSREQYPKQLAALADDALMQATALRLKTRFAAICESRPIWKLGAIKTSEI